MHPTDTPDNGSAQAPTDRRHPAITLCVADSGDVVLWQADPLGNDSAAIVVAPEHVEALATALRNLARDLNPPTALTNAERQRRYRERQRNGTVTPPD